MGIVRRTKSVDALLHIFEQSTEAFSSTYLVERLNREMNKTTVYRILERLQDDGILHSFKGKDGLQWYARCQGCSKEQHKDLHPHFQCQDCGKTECLNLDFTIPNVPKHKVDRAELLLIGLCEDCIS